VRSVPAGISMFQLPPTRLEEATSRAKSLSILEDSPSLFEPECLAPEADADGEVELQMPRRIVFVLESAPKSGLYLYNPVEWGRRWSHWDEIRVGPVSRNLQ
jgi:hypothetical protein